jgi:hypothetical protein
LKAKILYSYLITNMREAYPVRVVPIDCFILILLDDEYKLWSSSLCSVLQATLGFSIVGRNILIITLFLNTLGQTIGIVKPFSQPGYLVGSWWRTPLRHPPKITIDQ